MRVVTLKDVVHKGKTLFEWIKHDMDLEQILICYAKVMIKVNKSIELDQVRLKELGINDTCNLPYENLLTTILNQLIEADVDINNAFSTLQKTINGIYDAVSKVQDEKVKASAADNTSGFLSDKVKTLQPGTIVYNDSDITFVGFVPMSAVFYIAKDRVTDFDVSGKGKKGTDVYGYAICNGNNGTSNRLGLFPRYTDDVSKAGQKGGKKEFTVIKDNLESMDIPVNGSINNFTGTQKGKLSFDVNRISDGAGGSVNLLRAGDGSSGQQGAFTTPIVLDHTHSFSLQASLQNTSPVPIPLLPEHILEIPIQRIPV
jgi:hypothetical protein